MVSAQKVLVKIFTEIQKRCKKSDGVNHLRNLENMKNTGIIDRVTVTPSLEYTSNDPDNYRDDVLLLVLCMILGY